jgi:hypothetical protein
VTHSLPVLGAAAGVIVLFGVGIGFGLSLLIVHPSPQATIPQLAGPTLDLGLGSGSTTLSAGNMAPGDTIERSMTITNSSGQAITYTMRHGAISESSAPLAAELQLTIKTVGSSCDDFDGTTLFLGPLDQAAFGDASNAQDLAAASAAILCFRVALPVSAGNDVQGASATVPLSFTEVGLTLIPNTRFLAESNAGRP